MFGTQQSFLVGAAAKEEIEDHEVMAYVPNKCLITVDRAVNSEIGFVFANHENFFKACQERDFRRLVVFLMYECQKGEGSFWFPYIQAVEPGVMPCYWDEKYISSFDDRELRDQLREYKAAMEDEWQQLSKILSLYSPDTFDLEVCTYDLYKWCSAFVESRCFGWGLPTTFLAPLLDGFNHQAGCRN